MQIDQEGLVVFLHPLLIQRIILESRGFGLLHHDAQIDLAFQGIPARLVLKGRRDRPCVAPLPAAMILSLI